MKQTIVPSVLSSRAAVEHIPDGATVVTSGFCMAGLAHSLHRALVERFDASGGPTNLTYIHAAGHDSDTGLDVLALRPMVRRVIGGHWGLMPVVRQLIADEKIEAHNWPQGVIVGALRAAAGGEDGLRSRIGLGTFVDPRVEGGCANATAQRAGSLIRLVEQDGHELLHYTALEPDFALLRAWSADKMGNVTLGLEPLSLSLDLLAMAARNRGGKVICQVREIVDTVFPAHQIMLPGFMIDALVLADEPETEHRQCPGYDADPALLSSCFGEEQAFAVPIPPVPAGPRGWIGRRAALEIHDGDILNLGIGIPGDTVGSALYEAGRSDSVVSSLESGVFGGTALGGHDFGVALYPAARIDQAAMFDMYHGGGLDIGIMGAAEIDREGNINVSRFNGRAVGCGGFIDITQSARRVVFCTTLTVGDLEASYADGRVTIAREGKHRKFVERVGQITFNGQRALERGQTVTLVTERCVFEFTARGWELTEVAPGIDVQRDILPNLDFEPLHSAPGVMPDSCFTGSARLPATS